MPGKHSISCVTKLSVDEFNILENIMQACLRNKTRVRSLLLKISKGYSQRTETAKTVQCLVAFSVTRLFWRQGEETQDRASLCGPSCLGTSPVKGADLKLSDLPVSCVQD